MTLPKRIGILGGTFDPIHYGHLVIAQEAAARLDLDQVLFIPTGHPPHKVDERVSPGHHRLTMVELAIADDPRFALSRVELERTGPSYTVDTLVDLHSSMDIQGARAWFLIIGGDMLADLPQWRDPRGIVAQVAGIAAMYRPGFVIAADQIAALEVQVPGLRGVLKPIEAPQIAVSSTMLRARVAAGLPIRYLTPDPVVAYIAAQGLYRTEGMP